MLRFAVLGCGRIGRMHAETLGRHPRVDLLWVYDVATAAAAATAAASGAAVAADIDTVLEDDRVDAVLIATPTPTHVDLIVRSVRAGKAVLCEKPIDLDIGRVDACWAAIRDLSPRVMIGFNRRFDPTFRRMLDRVGAGEIGRLEQLIITSRDPGPPPASYVAVSGGMFRDMTIHDLDMARAFLGDVVTVSAQGANVVDPAFADHGDVDSGVVVMTAADGAIATLINSRHCAFGYDQRIEAFGSAGMLMADNQRATSVQFWGDRATASRDPVLDFFISRYRDAYVAEIDYFVDSVVAGSPPSPSFADGRAALRLADAAGESLRTGQRIDVALPGG